MHLVRVTGGLHETLLLPDNSVRATVRDVAFDAGTYGQGLIEDGTHRFRAATAAEVQAAADAKTQAVDAEDQPGDA